MSYENKDILETLRLARQKKGLSQRDLSRRIGLPQGHISKIENNSVDPQLSSLIQWARALDLELQLVPKKALSAVESIVRSTRPKEATSKAHELIQEMQILLREILRKVPEHENKLKPLIGLLRELNRFQYSNPEFLRLKDSLNEFSFLSKYASDRQIKNKRFPADTLLDALSSLQTARNIIVHDPSFSDPHQARPAYTLGDEHG